MAGILKIVGTPIGNLRDISPRAVDTLKTSQVILAENVTHSKRLLSAIGVDLHSVKLISCEQHEELGRIKVILERLRDGDQISIISDAGAPAVSDPGGRLVDAVVDAGYVVEVIPGPSAVIAALMGAGLVSHRFVFLGFLPKKGKERERLIRSSSAPGFALVIFESPNRVISTLEDLFQWCGAKRVVVARELTKQFETFHRGVLGAVLEPAWIEKGEAVIVVEGGEEITSEISESDVKDRISQLRGEKLSTKEIAKQIASETGMVSKEAYARVIDSLNHGHK